MNTSQQNSCLSQSYGRVAVIYGGNSAEREISLLSGEAIYNALQEKKIDSLLIDSKNASDGANKLHQKLIDEKIDRVFIALHGRDGEDGVIQGFLKIIGLPFTGSNTESCAIAMNKLVCKQIWQQIGLPTAAYELVNQAESFDLEKAKKIMGRVGQNLFVKPIREGSSVGMSKTESAEMLVDAVVIAQQYDAVLIEAFIQGDEYTVALLDGITLPSIRMTTPREFYDYEAKYSANTTEYFCPSGLSKIDELKLQDTALQAFQSTGCSGWGRVDFIQNNKSGQFELLEINTIPGMTKSSLVPKAAKAAGIDFPSLVEKILLTSCEVRND